jgi:flagellar biosynthesis/type III secretory pathway chaperone
LRSDTGADAVFQAAHNSEKILTCFPFSSDRTTKGFFLPEAGMESPVVELEHILKSEVEIYERVASIEEEKTEAIMSRNGHELEAFVREQERLLSEIAELEIKRESSIDRYRVLHRLDEVEHVSLEAIVRNMDEDAALKLTQYGMELKKTMLRVGSLSHTNKRLIEDNMEFFEILLSGIKSSASIQGGYNRCGDTSQMMHKPLLFNKTV